MTRSRRNELAVAALCAGALAVACGRASDGGGVTAPQPTASAAPQASASGAPNAPVPAGSVEVLLCDGKTKATFATGTPGTTIAGALMNEWMKKNPNAHWEADEREAHSLPPAADNRALIGQVSGQTYGRITEKDVVLWQSEAERVALAGSRVFHGSDELGSAIGVSCDMCHPNAANTHPETYPKFQPQLGHVALLRDMINWCIEHPVRGKVLASDDPKMRALEAYVLAERAGAQLAYGKR